MGVLHYVNVFGNASSTHFATDFSLPRDITGICSMDMWNEMDVDQGYNNMGAMYLVIEKGEASFELPQEDRIHQIELNTNALIRTFNVPQSGRTAAFNFNADGVAWDGSYVYILRTDNAINVQVSLDRVTRYSWPDFNSIKTYTLPQGTGAYSALAVYDGIFIVFDDINDEFTQFNIAQTGSLVPVKTWSDLTNVTGIDFDGNHIITARDGANRVGRYDQDTSRLRIRRLVGGPQLLDPISWSGCYDITEIDE